MDAQLQRALNMEAFDAAKQIRLQREQVDEAVAKLEESKKGRSGTATTSSTDVRDTVSEVLSLPAMVHAQGTLLRVYSMLANRLGGADAGAISGCSSCQGTKAEHVLPRACCCAPSCSAPSRRRTTLRQQSCEISSLI